jgi:hypothetical protein
LADTLHNFADAATAIPLAIAFAFARLKPTRRFPYGYGRVEDLAGSGARPLFGRVFARPNTCGQPGFCTDATIGQDTGDILALLDEGYNFDGAQVPPVTRLGDLASLVSIYSVPNFYGAHGHDSTLPSMSAILFAAGPSFKQGNHLGVVRNIDIAPTVLKILGVDAPATVDGAVIPNVLY